MMKTMRRMAMEIRAREEMERGGCESVLTQNWNFRGCKSGSIKTKIPIANRLVINKIILILSWSKMVPKVSKWGF